jgi:hypothetical protein
MFNPFVPFTRPLLNAFVKAGKIYFVRQTYHPGTKSIEEGVKGSFIFTHYSNIAFAHHHMSAIAHDPKALLYNWNISSDRDRLLIAAAPPPGYKTFSTVMEKDWEKYITDAIKDKVKSFIDRNLGWRPGRDETVDFQVFTNYGELFARLKLRKQEVHVKLELIGLNA